MSTELVTQNQFSQMTEEEQRQFKLFNPQCYVVNRQSIDKVKNQNSLLDKCFQILTKAYIYKGLNIDSEKIKSMAVLLLEDISKKYAYVSIFKIEEVLQENKYGEGFNVSIKGFIDVLDTHLYEINKANKLRAIELEREANTPLLSDNRTDEERQLAIIQKAYESYLINGFIFDFNNEIFQFILENGMYDWSDEEIQRAESIAEYKAKEFVGRELSKARRTFDNKEARSLSEIIGTDVRKHDSFGNINKTELVKLFFKKMKEQNIEKITLKTK